MQIERKKISDMERATYNPRIDLIPGDMEYETLLGKKDEILAQKLPISIEMGVLAMLLSLVLGIPLSY